MHRHPKQRSPRSRAVLLLCALWVVACDSYDSGLLPPPSSANPGGSGGSNGGSGGGGGTGGGGTGGDDDAGGQMCVEMPEQCNLEDDDCDGETDEDTIPVCEETIVNAQVQCVTVRGTASCVLVRCRDGFDNCDGDPANGCEPYCSCNECDDAGTEDGGI